MIRTYAAAESSTGPQHLAACVKHRRANARDSLHGLSMHEGGCQEDTFRASVKLKTPMGNQVHHFGAAPRGLKLWARFFVLWFMAYHFGMARRDHFL